MARELDGDEIRQLEIGAQLADRRTAASVDQPRPGALGRDQLGTPRARLVRRDGRDRVVDPVVELDLARRVGRTERRNALAPGQMMARDPLPRRRHDLGTRLGDQVLADLVRAGVFDLRRRRDGVFLEIGGLRLARQQGVVEFPAAAWANAFARGARIALDQTADVPLIIREPRQLLGGGLGGGEPFLLRRQREGHAAPRSARRRAA